MEMRWAVMFFPNFYIFLELFSGLVKGIGREDDGLYVFYYGDVNTTRLQAPSTIPKFVVPKPPPTVNMITNHRIMDIALRHKRLEHTPEKTLRSIVVFQNCACKNTTESCTVCPLAKQIRLPFPLRTTNTIVCFHGNKSDSGSEFLNSQVVELLRSKGIIDQTSCIYTLKQNGVVKRRHKYILDVARSLRFQAVVPLRFWGECITIAMYIINRLPSAPFEVLLCHAPFLGHMTMFGCLGYVTESQLIPSTPSLSSPSGEFSLHNTAVSLLAEPSLPLSSPLPSPKAPLTRRSSRNSRPPIWIKDYVTHDKGKAHCCYPISTYVSYDNVSSSFGIALTAYSSIIEPKTFSKGVKDPKWVAAMKDEILAL
ncbi:uncharacterized protein [Nicotiana sylvestris]|uniref:uncharacterized protein n=1 Tax=Nicotiana sylvestris TaxID=4096 RepID=UPI00388CC447